MHTNYQLQLDKLNKINYKTKKKEINAKRGINRVSGSGIRTIA